MNKPPNGYLLNAAGHLVPQEQVRDHDKLRDAVARDLATEAQELNQRLRDFKARALADVADVVSIAAERYNVKMGGKKGNVTLTTYDGQYKITRTYAERLTFTEELEAARELINQCILRWSEGANAHIKALVDRAFRTDGQGKIKTAAVLDLLRLDIDDDGWRSAMEALKDSIQIIGTTAYLRIYKRIGQTDNYQPIPLDIAAL
ncbi:DUF3164 family protein [Spongiibacter sp. UBA1325]|uniref:DUF3164 family protein n=1 Tax=Spongiibacter sp. UBA1325 TaxID=1947543 RepID=UPI00257F071B|nr:DUF3164 family protein [Spongiibacter sp. UBA1325]|tara:strand:+ start:186 stop:797 length:612 start_codon:yes stop_codon:yes gene_type:complete